jgi:hypothetical protein
MVEALEERGMKDIIDRDATIEALKKGWRWWRLRRPGLQRR